MPSSEGSLAPGISIRYLRLPQVLDRSGLKKTTIYALQKAGRFPQSVSLTAGAVGWVETEVEAWLANRAASRARSGAPKGRLNT